ncbi:hypothetical protein ACGF0J_17375 [Nonomuraea sp. NPDC047897]|uniref:hypothetical protein n=1 Tax=Nonomuraea sp. NPDC047897 TaxID=3364346 RepID=UPI0037185FE7
MNFCLSDLVPPLRWSDASTITLLTGQPDLPDAWWRSLPLPRVLAVIGPEALGDLLTEIALAQWPAAAVGDVLPALHVLDPDEADEPHVAIALDRVGSWAGLLALTGRELVDQPFIQARAVLATLFSAVLVRLAPTAVPNSVPAAVPAAGGVQDDAGPRAAAEAVPEPVEELRAVQPPAGEARGEEPPADEARTADEAEATPAATPEAGPEESVPEPAAAGAGEPDPADSAHDEAHSTDDGAHSTQDDETHSTTDDEADSTQDDEREVAAVAVPETDVESSVESEAESGPAPVSDAGAGDEAGADSEPAPVARAEQDAGAEDASGRSPDLSALIEAAFAGLDDKSWAVAQNRVFTDQPSAVDQLAKLFAVPPTEIAETEARLRERLDRWLASDEAAPYRAHLDELRRAIGPAVPKESLIKAADWHRKEIRALEVPAWQFVLATLPDRPGGGARDGAPPPSAFSPLPPPPPIPPPAPPPAPPVAPPVVPPAVAAPFPAPQADGPAPGSRFHPFAPATPAPVNESESNGAASEEGHGKPYQPLKDVSQTRRCFRQPDGRWWLRVDVTGEQLAGGECALPTGFAAYLGLSPGETRTVRSAAGELTMSWHGRPVLESVERLLVDVGAREGGHLFLTLSDEGVLRARHLPVAAQGAEKITKALRLVGYTAPGGTREQAARVIATRIGMAGPVGLPDLLARLRERGDRDLLDLLD